VCERSELMSRTYRLHHNAIPTEAQSTESSAS